VIAALVAFVTSVVCILLAAWQWKKTPPDDAAVVARRVQRADPGVDANAIELGSGRAAELAQRVLLSPSRAHAIAEINEELLLIDRDEKVGGGLPASGARVALATGTLLAIVGLARGLAVGSVGIWPVLAFGAGLFGAVGCAALGMSAKKRTRVRREGWNELTRVLALRLDQKPGRTD
jgi:hypothetical protein